MKPNRVNVAATVRDPSSHHQMHDGRDGCLSSSVFIGVSGHVM
jgi:hypothetical protein